jgi:hypothetical protein
MALSCLASSAQMIVKKAALTVNERLKHVGLVCYNIIGIKYYENEKYKNKEQFVSEYLLY